MPKLQKLKPRLTRTNTLLFNERMNAMQYTTHYQSPLGGILLAADKIGLTVYFSGMEPSFYPPVHMIGTPFQLSVWKILQKIPYGQTVTYGEIAKEIAELKGISHMSAQAVGGAVGHNEISIIVPCHRVVGTNGSLTGYAGGIDRKVKLLTLENADMRTFFIPKKGTAL